jgi:N-acetylmuramoyl-L-alanine amidase
MKRMAISAGHYPEEPGAEVSFEQEGQRVTFIEHALACQLIGELYPLLIREGYSVFETPRSTLTEKVQFVNSLPDIDLALEVHFNSGPPEAKGAETIYFSERGKSLARLIQSGLIHHLPFSDRGVKKDEEVFRGGEPLISYFLRETYPPAVLVEVCFLTNPDDRAFLFSDGAFPRIAAALRKGLDDYYLNVKLVEVSEWVRLS